MNIDRLNLGTDTNAEEASEQGSGVETNSGFSAIYEEVVITPEQKTATAKRSLEKLEKESQVLENFALTVESYRDASITEPLAKEKYDRLFGNLKAGLLAGLQIALFEKLLANPGASTERLGTMVAELLALNITTLQLLAKRQGNATALSLSELEQSLTDTESTALALDRGAREAIEGVNQDAALYEKILTAPVLRKSDSPATKQQEAQTSALTKKYLESVAQKIQQGGNPAGCGDALVNILRATMHDTVAEGRLSLAEWEKIQSTIQTKYSKVFERADPRNLEDWENLLQRAGEQEDPESYLIKQKSEMLEVAKEAGIEAKSNPYNLFTRKYGELKWVLLFAAEKWIYATLGLNVALNGTKTLKNPAFLGLSAVAGGMYLYQNPEVLKGKSEQEQDEKETVEAEIQELLSTNPVLANWLGLVEQKDLQPDRPLATLLVEKSQGSQLWLNSAELQQALHSSRNKLNAPSIAISEKDSNNNAKELFSLLVSCQKLGISPQKIITAEKNL